MLRFLTFPPFCYLKIRKKTMMLASLLHGFVLLFFCKKIDVVLGKYVHFISGGDKAKMKYMCGSCCIPSVLPRLQSHGDKCQQP